MTMLYVSAEDWSWKPALREEPCPAAMTAVESLYYTTQKVLYELTGMSVHFYVLYTELTSL
jgi:hypothetical protein